MTLRIEVGVGGADAEERDEATRALRAELLELDVDAVDRPSAPAPDGARGGEAVTLGTLLVTLGPSALAAVAGAIQSWWARRGDRSVVLELDGDRVELSNASDEDRRLLVDAFLARHEAR
jgi:hypothetical protein